MPTQNSIDLKRITVGRALAFLIEVIIPNWVALLFHPSPTATGLAFFLLIYLLFKDGLSGQSLGKRVFKLMVIDKTTNQPCGLGKSLLRNIDMLLPFMPLLELVILWFSKDGRRIGDRLANTVVVMVSEDVQRVDE